MSNMASPQTIKALIAANAMPLRSDTPQRAKHLSESINGFLYKMAHEPSLAAYRIQEHVHKTVKPLSSICNDANSQSRRLKGTVFDLVCTSEFLDSLDESVRNSEIARATISELASKISSMTSTNNTSR